MNENAKEALIYTPISMCTFKGSSRENSVWTDFEKMKNQGNSNKWLFFNWDWYNLSIDESPI